MEKAEINETNRAVRSRVFETIRRRLKKYAVIKYATLAFLGAVVVGLSWASLNYYRGVLTTVNAQRWFGLLLYNSPPKPFIGSPPRQCAIRRGTLDLNQHGWILEKIWKEFRTTSWHALGPGLFIFNYPIHLLSGWDICNPKDGKAIIPCEVHHNQAFIKEGMCQCVAGKVYNLHISEGDGDINIHITLPPQLQYLTVVKQSHFWSADRILKDPQLNDWPTLLTEIDDSLRANFPVLDDLKEGDFVKACGQWVLDRDHPHNELHPLTWLEITSKIDCPTQTSTTTGNPEN